MGLVVVAVAFLVLGWVMDRRRRATTQASELGRKARRGGATARNRSWGPIVLHEDRDD